MNSQLSNLLIKAGLQAPSADNSQPWLITLHDNVILLSADIDKIRESCFSIHHPAILLALGAVIENIVQAASFYNIKLASDYAYPDTTTGKCATFTVTSSDEPVISGTTPDLHRRCTNRLRFLSKPVPETSISEILTLSAPGSRLKFYQQPTEIRQWAKWICSASEIRFQTPDVHEWFGRSLKFTSAEVATGQGLDVNTLGLTWPAKLFLKLTQTWNRMRVLNWFGAYKFIAMTEANNIKKAPGLLAIFTAKNELNGIEAGRLMERVWIKANSLGLSLQPYFVITDQIYRYENSLLPTSLNSQIERLNRQLSASLGLEQEYLSILFRIGFCDSVPINSLRISKN